MPEVIVPSVTDDVEVSSTGDEHDELIDDELLVEDVSIDGMCGVY